jgi:hypothetical protein
MGMFPLDYKAHGVHTQGLWGLGLILALWAGGCSRSSSDAPIVIEPTGKPEAAIKALTGARARLVWIEDQDDQKDARGKKNHFKLKVLDTENGQGERDLLTAAGIFTKPMITPKGNRVVFTDNSLPKVLVVNWDGSGLREITPGYGVAVWIDPGNGLEWVYVQTGTNTTDKTFDQNPIRRYQIDNPKVEELVWDKTPVSSRWCGNFQLSADGTKAGGMFPWPDTGVAELPNKSLKNFGAGCWTSMTRDGTDRFWKFDGAHRHVLIYSADSFWSSKVNVSIEGYEVYHPRWSNLDRFLILSGPYKEGKGSEGRIYEGGKDVEIYLGRLNPKFNKIEQWVRVTRNAQADFFPDVWIEPASPYAAARVPQNHSAANVTNTGPSLAVSSWPESTNGLVFVWEDRMKQNEVVDPANGTTRRCNVEARGLAKYGRYYVMEFAGRGAFVPQDVDDVLLEACRANNAFTVEALVVPAIVQSNRLARIVTFSSGEEQRNFTLGQEEDRLLFLLKTTAEAPETRLEIGSLRAGRPAHVVVTYASGYLSTYIDGAPARTTKVPGDLSGWSAHHLIFGDEWSGAGGDWAGQLEGIALYDGALSVKEVQQTASHYLARLKERRAAPQLIVQAKLKETTATPSPESIAPYRRCLVVYEYHVEKVLSGDYPQKALQVAHWGLMDGKVLAQHARHVGQSYQLRLEPFEQHPQLESERLAMDSTQFDLPLYYDPNP